MLSGHGVAHRRAEIARLRMENRQLREQQQREQQREPEQRQEGPRRRRRQKRAPPPPPPPPPKGSAPGEPSEPGEDAAAWYAAATAWCASASPQRSKMALGTSSADPSGGVEGDTALPARAPGGGGMGGGGVDAALDAMAAVITGGGGGAAQRSPAGVDVSAAVPPLTRFPIVAEMLPLKRLVWPRNMERSRRRPQETAGVEATRGGALPSVRTSGGGGGGGGGGGKSPRYALKAHQITEYTNRQALWQARRQERLRKLREEAEEQQGLELTFRPRTNARSTALVRRRRG
jgi:hypothetical protein